MALGTVLAMLTVARGALAPATLRQPDARTVTAAIAEDGLRARHEALARATEGSDHYRAVGSTGCDRAAAFVDEGGSSLAVGGCTFGAEGLRPLIFAPPGDVDGPIVPIDWDPTATDRTGEGRAVTHYETSLPTRSWSDARAIACDRTLEVVAWIRGTDDMN